MGARGIIVLIFTAQLGACSRASESVITRDDAINITNEQLAGDTPQVGLEIFTIETSETKDRWRVTYDVPEGSTGTPIIFEVDKNSGEIVHAHRNQ